MIANLALILLCQLIGEAVVRGAKLVVPGPVIGMGLLFVYLIVRDRYLSSEREPKQKVEATAKGLLASLALLFVPAGVGVTQNLDLIADRGIAIFLALTVSVIATLLATVLTFIMISRLMGSGGESTD
ncbi:CidA/LrgA family protein [Tardiphaga alba]|uniref:CidA/LrgA family protein n=1 Tax=Tardiphaga alba TaxID=340268 RepID=A0ABX8AIM2_9BRAD|nr:CidA/LrgA family protein [Tardiphaga alba]QUS42243.1 CidA/LrgA family protein [Tardiphaga alba]